MISAYFNPDDNALREQSLQYLGWFFLLAGGVLFGVLCRVSVWTYLGERLTRKLRLACFTAVTQQPGAFFDRPENAVGRLTTRLATDCALVKGAAGESLGSTLEGFAAVVAALAIAFSASWRLALVLLVAFPLLVIGGVFEFRSVAQISKGGNKELENAGELLSEAITAVRTVQAYGLQPTTYASFTGALVGPYAQGIRRAVVTGLGGGFQRFILLATYSLAFYSGAQFFSQAWLTFPNLINVFLAITLAAD
jgi:ABC-type multidrug transport system fused ATPase/permease subunit